MTNRLLVMIANKDMDENQLRLAIRQLGTVTEPPSFWNDIANDPTYDRVHRRYSVFQLFSRHVRPGMKLAELAFILKETKWLDDKDITVVEDLGGYIPVKLTHDSTVFVIHVLPDSEFWAIFLSVSGHIDRNNFSRLLRGETVDQATKDAVILEIGFSPADVVTSR